MTTEAQQTLPVATDTAIANQHGKLDRLEAALDNAQTAFRIENGQRKVWDGRLKTSVWSAPLSEVLSEETLASLPADHPLVALRAQIVVEKDELARLNAIFREHRWSRFFLVTSSKGHIHSSMHCSTCRYDTQYGWLPNLSGLTEKDAVEDQGEILCSVCFPTAPVAWTKGESKASKEEKAKRAEEKAARNAAKLAKALLPDGSVLKIEGGERFQTLHTAQAYVLDGLAHQIDNRFWAPYGYNVNGWNQLLGAIAAKLGVTTEEVLETLRPKAEKKVRQFIKDYKPS